MARPHEWQRRPRASTRRRRQRQSHQPQTRPPRMQLAPRQATRGDHPSPFADVRLTSEPGGGPLVGADGNPLG
nr:MAG TPA_asm: hypothetical protein [Caudoviricetes sp.]